MAGSDLQEVLDLIFARKTVDQILTGKAIAQAVGVHRILLLHLQGLPLRANQVSSQIK